MLKTLDSVAWDEIYHAYGVASDIPEIVRKLLSKDENSRADAILELWECINHQGSIYEASPYVIPFLYELIDSDGVDDKSEIAGLIATIIDGYPVDGKEEKSPIKQRVITEARKDLSLLLKYLRDKNFNTRLDIARALGNIYELSDELTPVIDDALVNEKNDLVKNALKEAKTRLSDI